MTNATQEKNGLWGVDIFFGGQWLRRSFYDSEAHAADADCSDGPGDRGCVALTRDSASYADATREKARAVAAARVGWGPQRVWPRA